MSKQSVMVASCIILNPAPRKIKCKEEVTSLLCLVSKGRVFGEGGGEAIFTQGHGYDRNSEAEASKSMLT